jgi:hypothetical protein
MDRPATDRGYQEGRVRSTVLIFPRRPLRPVPRPVRIVVERRRDPLLFVVIVLNAFLTGAIAGVWWCLGRGW